MNLSEIQMPRDAAKAALEEYRTSVREQLEYDEFELLNRVEKRRAEFERADREIMEGYRALANGRQVIGLRSTLIAGGEDKEHRPRLAIARADEPVIELARFANGRVDFNPTTRRDSRGWSIEDFPRSTSNRAFSFLGLLPEITARSTIRAQAMAPHIPPHLRPKTLDRYFVLWEANWEKLAPVDPALLRKISGDLYVVVATWDLTELERAVLNGQ